ncbi:hypothetical protein [Mycetocola saprophilus]|uniref:hypothetical protein n=1 Tax=Mycetocola saprophilus TaxID=76636 RepID=UPI003BF284E8
MADTQRNAPKDERERCAEEMPAFGSEAVRDARFLTGSEFSTESEFVRAAISEYIQNHRAS